MNVKEFQYLTGSHNLMNQNIEYEKFTQGIYQELINARGITANVEHNVKLIGNSGQKHQIDVYWEYEVSGVLHKVAIECKNYNRKLSVDKVNAFRGVLADLTDVKGIMITQKGYQSGAKKIANSCGINLKELRSPNEKDDCTVAEIRLSLDMSLTQRLFSLDNDWAKANNINWLSYRNFSASFSQRGDEWGENYLPLDTVGDAILDEKGNAITTFDKLVEELPQKTVHVFDFNNAYVITSNWGKVKIQTVKYLNSNMHKQKLITLEARNIVKAILKDALNGEIIFFSKDINTK